MRVLFSCFPAFGHLYPMLPLADAARRAGHHVAIATGPEMVAAARAKGFDAWPVGLTQSEIIKRYVAEHGAVHLLPPDERMLMGARHMVVEVAAPTRIPELLPAAERWAPDLVFHDPAEMAAPVAAARTGAALVVHGFGLHLPDTLRSAVLPGLERLYRSWGQPTLAEELLASPYLDLGPESLRPADRPLWADARPLRPVAVGGEDDDEVDRLFLSVLERMVQPETIHVTFGTVFNHVPGAFRAVLAGLEGLSANVVVTVGPDFNPAHLGQQPPNVIVERLVPHGLLLPRCNLVITHAGTGTVLGALANGVPLLLVPQGADHFRNAAACEKAGAGLVLLGGPITASAVRSAVDRLLNEPGFALAAQRVQREIAAMPSPDDVIESMTRWKRPR